MELIKIGTTDIILQEFSEHSGKIIISDDKWNNFSYQWNAMGNPLKQFLCDIGSDYFVRNLSNKRHGEINMRKTMKAVRHWWKHESGIKWYEYMDFQKDLREAFNEIERNAESANDFIDLMGNLKNDLYIHTMDRDYKSESIKSSLKSLGTEPWYFIVEDEPREYKWLADLHKKLRKELQKQLNTV